jgi:hypothetical protein
MYEACNELGRQKYHKILMDIEVIFFVTYHWKGLCHYEMELKLMFYFSMLI